MDNTRIKRVLDELTFDDKYRLYKFLNAEARERMPRKRVRKWKRGKGRV